MKKAVIFVVSFFVCIFFCADAIAIEFGKLNMRGTEEGKFFGYKKKTDLDDTLFRGESKLQLDMDYDFNDKISLKVVPEVYYDTNNLASDVIDSLREQNERRYMGNLEEAYVVYSGDQYDFSLGKRIYTWGKADSFKPLDNLNSYEFTDVPDYRKLGLFSAAFNYSWPQTSISVVVAPFFTPSRLPEKDSRWAISAEKGSNALVSGGQFQVNFWIEQLRLFLESFGITLPGLTASTPNMQEEIERFSSIEPRELPPKQFRNMQGGIRINTSKEGWDFTLSYYDGFNNVAVIKKLVTSSQVLFIPTYNKMREIGGALSTTWGQMEIHGELAQHFTDGQADDDYAEYVFGGSYSWDRTQIHQFEEVKLFLEYAGEKVTNYRSNDDYISYTGYCRPFRNTLISRLMAKFDQDNQLDLSVIYNFGDDDNLVQPKFTHTFNDNWKLVAGLDIFSGKADTFWGKWDRNDRIFTFVTYSF